MLTIHDKDNVHGNFYLLSSAILTFLGCLIFIAFLSLFGSKAYAVGSGNCGDYIPTGWPSGIGITPNPAPTLTWSLPDCASIFLVTAIINGSGIVGDGQCVDNTGTMTSCDRFEYNANADLLANTTYTVNVSYYFIDLETGDPASLLTSWNFTTAAAAPPIPDAPTNFSGVAQSASSIFWTWDPPTNAPVDLYRWKGGLIMTNIEGNYTETGLGANYQSQGWVTACNVSGCSEASNTATQYTYANPPGSCSGSVSGNSITWSWISNNNPAGTNYYASNPAGNSGWITSTNWSQSSLTCNTTYNTQVKAKNNSGQETSSVTCSATTDACPQPPDYTIEEFIVDTVGATTCVGDDIDVSVAVYNQGLGNAAVSSTSRVKDNDTAFCSDTTPALAVSESHSFSSCIWTPSSSGPHTLVVYADDDYDIVESDEDNNSASDGPITVMDNPDSVTGLGETGATIDSITWEWDTIPGATSYDIYLDGSSIETNWGSTSYTVSNLTCNSSYTIQVLAVNTCSITSDTDAASTNTCVCDTDADCGSTGNVCTTYSCINPSTNSAACQISNLANGTSCNADSNGCTQNDSCQTGVCTAGSAPDCSDGLVCTDDICISTGNTAFSCSNPYQVGFPKCTLQSDCDDADSNTQDICSTPGVCTGSCSNTSCPSDSWYDTGSTQWVFDTNLNQCQDQEKEQKEQEFRDYSSVNGSACTYSATNTRWLDTGNTRTINKTNGTSCNADSNGCTQNDSCQTGVCTAGSAPDCSDGLVCTDDTCTSTGNTAFSCSNPLQNGNCLISSTCYTDNTENPSNECQECSSGSSQTSWSNKADNTQCGSAINYCFDTASCDTHEHYKSCQAGTCSTSTYVSDSDVSGTLCSGESCGSFTDYCLSTPGKLRDYASNTGTCSLTSETCDSPSFSDYCLVDSCSAECDTNNCSTSQCTGTNSAYYQTRSATCQSDCMCTAWGPYSACLDSWNMCGQKVECYQGSDCDTSIGSCSCNTGFIPDGSGGCIPAGMHWHDMTGWSDCSVQCGTGTQTRTVECHDGSHNTLPNGQCVSNVGPKWSESQSCDAGSCTDTACLADGCYGTLKWHDYPPTVPNACISGACENNTCSATKSCSVDQCSAECDTNNCSTSQCDSFNGQTYLQTRSSTCQSSCICPAWSAYDTCEQSYNNCSVECYQGTGCDTTDNDCTCQSGYTPDGSGGCNLIVTPDFDLDLPTSDEVTQGTDSQNTITVNALNGFNSSIGSWSVLNCPSNASCSVNPESCSSPYDNCDLTITTDSVSPGDYGSIKVQGIGNGLTRTSSSMTLTVNTVPDTQDPICGSPSYSPSGWTYGSVTVTISCSDNDSGCVQPSYSKIVSVNGPGSIIIADNAGNTKSCPYDVTNIDKLAPTLISPTYLTVEETACSGASCPATAPTITSGDPLIQWTTDDTGGSNLKQTETWRATGDCNTPTGWTKIDTDTVNAANGSYTDSGVSNGTYCYGIHAVDNASNCRNEDGTLCEGPDLPTTARGPITVVIARVTPDFSLLNDGPITIIQEGGTQDVIITVQSTNGFSSSVSLSDNCSSSNLSCSWPSGSSCTPPTGSTCQQTLRIGPGTATAGPKTVVVTGTDASVDHTTNIEVTVNSSGGGDPPVASFTYCLPDPINSPNTIQFTDTSTDDGSIIAWDWDFGDLSANSSLQNPTHDYDTGITSFLSDPLNPLARYWSLLLDTIKTRLFALFAPQSAQAQPSWWDSLWQYRRQIIFDNSGQSQNLVNVPVLIKLNTSRINYAQTQNKGQDVRFIDADGSTILAHEIESWNGSGNSYVWVKIPQIDGSSSIDSIWMYYGNTTAPDAQNTAGVWSNGYAGVWHLNDGDSTAVNFYQDSTINNNNGTLTDDNGNSVASAGQIANAYSFNGDADYIDVGKDPSLQITGAMTLEAWLYRSANTWHEPLNRAGNSGKLSWTLDCSNSGCRFRITPTGWGSGWEDSGYATVSPNVWKYITGVFNPSTAIQIYVDGALDLGSENTSDVSSSMSKESSVSMTIGATSVPDEFLDGSLDEVRISNVIRSADWIAAQYLSMTDTLISTYGTEETQAPSGPPYTVTLTVTDDDLTEDTYIDNTVDPATTPPCGFNLTNVGATSCALVSVGWKHLTNADKYDIYRQENGTGFSWLATVEDEDAIQCPPVGCNYDDTSVTANKTYDYYIDALRLDATRLKNSTVSPVCDGATTPTQCDLGTSTPSACSVTGPVAISQGCGQIEVTWNAAAGVDSYNIYRSLSPSGTFTVKDSVINTQTSLYDTDVLSDVIYYYYVTAMTGPIESAASPIVSASMSCFRSPTFIER